MVKQLTCIRVTCALYTAYFDRKGDSLLNLGSYAMLFQHPEGPEKTLLLESNPAPLLHRAPRAGTMPGTMKGASELFLEIGWNMPASATARSQKAWRGMPQP